ncbi:MAG: hypothetical protein CMJ81_06270 [Planctomycetaceae bacterium]|nr:hypothetical protein [Planctomycetaceae bacterium]MBP60511.1 hypothetical protein [Planctomycetaceae bacterium]
MQEPISHTVESVPRRRGELAAAIIFLIMMVSYNGVTPVFATRICEYFSLSAEQYGTTIGLGIFGEIAAFLLVGLIITRFGARRISELSFVGIGGCFLCIGLGASLFWLRCGIVFQGFFAGLAKVAIPAFLIALYPAYKRRMISIRYVAISIAGIGIPFWAAQLLKWSADADDRGFENAFFGPFLIVGCIIVAGSVLLSLSRQPPLQSQPETSRRFRLRDLLEFRSLTIVLLVALHTSADSTIFHFLAMFMEHHFDALSFSPAWALAGHNIAYLATRFLLSLLPEGFAQRKILTLAGPIGGCILLLMLWQGHAISIPLLYTLASLFYAAEFPVLISEISSRSMGHFGTVLATGFLAGGAANFVFLKGTGRLVDTTGDYRLALSVAACGFIAFGLVAAASGLGKSSSQTTIDT